MENSLTHRHSDFTKSGVLPDTHDVWVRTNDILDRLEATEKCCADCRRAFTLNDLGEPDIEGHRYAHLKMIESTEIMQDYKQTATKKIIGWVITFMLGAISVGIGMLLKK